MLIFVFLHLVVVFLCCYVVKLGMAQNKKKWKYFRAFFNKTSYGCICKSYCFFVVLLFFLVAQKHYTKGYFDHFDMLIF